MMNIDQVYELKKKTFENVIQKVYISSTGDHIAMCSGYPNYVIYLFNSEGTLMWEKEIGGHVSNIMISEDEAYVVYGIARGGTVGDVACHDIQGNLLWTYRTGKTIKSIYIAHDDPTCVVVGTNEGYIYLISEGNLIWNSKTRNWNEKVSVFMSEKTIHAISHQGIYYKFNPEAGMEPLEKKDLSIVIGNATFGKDGSALLHSMDTKGISFLTPIQKVLWNKSFENYISCVTMTESGDNIILGTNDGKVLVFDKLGNHKGEFHFSTKVNDVASNNTGIIVASNNFTVDFIDMSGKNLWSMKKESITITQDYLTLQKMAKHAQNMFSLASTTLSEIKSFGIDASNFEDIVRRAERALSAKKHEITINILRNALMEMRRVKKDAELSAEKKNVTSAAIKDLKDLYDRLELEGMNTRIYEPQMFEVEEHFSKNEFKEATEKAEIVKRKLESLQVHKSKAYGELAATKSVFEHISTFCNIDEELSIFENSRELVDSDPIEARTLIQKARELAVKAKQSAEPAILIDPVMDEEGSLVLELTNTGKAHAYDVNIDAAGALSIKVMKDFDVLSGLGKETVRLDMDIFGQGTVNITFTVSCTRKSDNKAYIFKKDIELEVS